MLQIGVRSPAASANKATAIASYASVLFEAHIANLQRILANACVALSIIVTRKDHIANQMHMPQSFNQAFLSVRWTFSSLRWTGATHPIIRCP
jgi:hypothetical protein